MNNNLQPRPVAPPLWTGFLRAVGRALVQVVRSHSALFMAPPQCDLAPSGTTFRMGLFVTPVPLPRGEVCWRISFSIRPRRSGQRLVGPGVCRSGKRRASGRSKKKRPQRGELRPQATFNPGFVWQSAGIGTARDNHRSMIPTSRKQSDNCDRRSSRPCWEKPHIDHSVPQEIHAGRFPKPANL